MKVLAHVTGTGWDDWLLTGGPVALFGVIVVGLVLAGRNGGTPALQRIPRALERITGIPGWAAATVGTAAGGLLVAVIGFYWDVAWHIDLGRDKELFSPPHTMILLGLLAIPLAGAVATAFATVTRAEVGLRVGPLRVPWSGLALLVIGGGALMGFPLDDVWHRAYGVDVTMWGPTHLAMIGGASITPIAMWLALAEAGVRPKSGRWAGVLHGVVAGAALTGLSTLQGEFDFGVPQFQALYHPVLVMVAAGAGLTAARIALGRGGAIRAAIGFIAIRGLVALIVDGFGHTVPHFPLYIAPAIAVEAAALILGTARVRRFAVGAGIGVATIGMAGEWAWTHVWGRHPWTESLLPEALWVGALAALAGVFLGTALGVLVSGEREVTVGTRIESRRIGGGVLAASLIVLAVALALPIKRTSGEVTADVTLQRADGVAFVEVVLHPADAAKGAHWFEVMAWQGGSLIYSPLKEVAPGRYRSDVPVPVTGSAKALIRLHRGSEEMAVPIYFPADPEIGASELPAVDRSARFERDTKLLQREAHAGSPWPARIIYGFLAAIVAAWLTVIGFASWRIGRGGTIPPVVLELNRKVKAA